MIIPGTRGWMELAGIVGKANVGKSTLFSALTMVDVGIGDYPFTTTKPNRGVTYLRTRCVCRELGVQDNPGNSYCVDGTRLVPIQVIDCPGIVRGAHMGRGLGLQFLDEIRQADALIVVADASGGTDADGTPVEPGSRDPVEDVRLVEEEVDRWLLSILERDWPRISRAAEAGQAELTGELARRLSGLRIDEETIDSAIRNAGLDEARPTSWREGEKLRLAGELRRLSKPMIVAANKADIPASARGIERLREAGYRVVPCSAEAERTLRIAASRGFIRYTPGDAGFEVVDSSRLTQPQRQALDRLAAFMEKNNGTGVQALIDAAYLDLLGYIPVFPVEDPYKLTDSRGRVLPDVYLVKRGDTPSRLAYKIHTELGESFLYAIDARTKMRLSSEYKLKPNDVISIVAARKHR